MQLHPGRTMDDLTVFKHFFDLLLIFPGIVFLYVHFIFPLETARNLPYIFPNTPYHAPPMEHFLKKLLNRLFVDPGVVLNINEKLVLSIPERLLQLPYKNNFELFIFRGCFWEGFGVLFSLSLSIYIYI